MALQKDQEQYPVELQITEPSVDEQPEKQEKKEAQLDQLKTLRYKD